MVELMKSRWMHVAMAMAALTAGCAAGEAGTDDTDMDEAEAVEVEETSQALCGSLNPRSCGWGGGNWGGGMAAGTGAAGTAGLEQAQALRLGRLGRLLETAVQLRQLQPWLRRLRQVVIPRHRRSAAKASSGPAPRRGHRSRPRDGAARGPASEPRVA
ncbi:hypothetical protein BE20_40905 [Sorangium cellulosum]|nr:hypothetical protein BE20_40905 [Sorangium cellulosum]